MIDRFAHYITPGLALAHFDHFSALQIRLLRCPKELHVGFGGAAAVILLASRLLGSGSRPRWCNPHLFLASSNNGNTNTPTSLFL